MLSMLTIHFVNAQVVAFPGAEGAGKNTTGGRGTATATTSVFAVTSLVDDGTNNTIGTLRWALNKTATYRTIVFRVSGTIHLVAPLKISKANTTIAGQTAPGEGICLADYPVGVDANNVIVRYIRFRMGDKNQNLGMVNGSGNDDAFDDASHNHNHIVIDHCTMSWSDDEACTFYGGDSLTLQWNMISEPLNYSYHFETGDADYEHHGYGGIWGGKHASFHHNLFAHCQGRVPRFDGDRNLGNGSTTGLENVDFVNNVLYNWGSYNTNGGEGGNYNIVNNYYKYGPSTSAGTTSGVKIKQEIINPYTQASPALPYGMYYLSGNYMDGSATVTNDNWKGAAFQGGTLADTTASKALVPFTIVPVTTQSAADAFGTVLPGAGCNLPNRDTLDQRIVKDVINRTGRIIDVQGGYPHLTPYAQTVNAWPSLISNPAPATSNIYNVPDLWLTQRGLSVSAALSGPNGYHTNGYTHLENFLNGDSIVAPGTLNNCIGVRGINSNNSLNWLSAKDSIYGYYNSPDYLVSTDTNNVVISIFDNANAGIIQSSYYTCSATRLDVNNHAYLNRNVTLTGANTLTAPVGVRIYFTNAEFNALKLADNTINSIADLVILQTDDQNCVTTMSGVPTVILPTASGVFGTYHTGYYVEFPIDHWGSFFIGSKISFPLPLQLISFSGMAQLNQVHLDWVTNNELNVDHFEVEKSVDGSLFKTINRISALNISGLQHYQSFDTYEHITVFYRLKVYDRDGHFFESRVIKMAANGNQALGVSPNPANQLIYLTHPVAAYADRIIVNSVDGKKVTEFKPTVFTTQTQLDVSQFSSGIYWIIYYNQSNQPLQIRFIKE